MKSKYLKLTLPFLLFLIICLLSTTLILIGQAYPQNKLALLQPKKTVYQNTNLDKGKKATVSKKKKQKLPLLDIKQETVQISGLTQSYQFLFISDSHLSIPDATESNSNIKSYLEERIFGNNKGNHTKDIFPSFITYANQNELDGFLMGGDILDSPAESNLTYLDQQLGSLMMPYLYTLGNHDWTYPWEYFSQTAIQSFIPDLEEITGETNSLHYIEYDDLLLISLDNSTNSVNQTTLDAFRLLQAKKKPIVLVMHVPINTSSLSEESTAIWGKPIALGEGGITNDQTTADFLSLVLQEDSMVKVILSGHLHFYHKELLKNGQLQFVAAPAFEGSGIHLTLNP